MNQMTIYRLEKAFEYEMFEAMILSNKEAYDAVKLAFIDFYESAGYAEGQARELVDDVEYMLGRRIVK